MLRTDFRRAIIETSLFSKTSSGSYKLLFAALLAVGLMFVDVRFPSYTDPVRFQLNGVLTPLYNMMSWPGRLSDATTELALDESQLRAENTYLNSQLLVLSGRLQKFSELAAENSRLRGLIDSTQVVDGRVLIAEIIGVDADPFRHIILLNKGQDVGAYIGQPILDSRGLMGQLIEVGPTVSRAMLIVDREHAVPVRIARNGVRAVVVGSGEIDRLRLQYVPESADVKVGDLLLSSGLGLRYPSGYPVGVVTRVGKSGTSEFAEIDAKPAAELDRSRHVLLLFNQPRRAEKAPTVMGAQ